MSRRLPLISPRILVVSALAATCLSARPLLSQTSASGVDQPIEVVPWISIGSEADERWRAGQLLARDSTDGYLLRSSATMNRDSPLRGSLRLSVFWPEIYVVANSNIPFSVNDGPLWAGHGWNTLLTVGGRVTAGPFALVLAPQVAYSQNLPFPVPANPHPTPPGRDRFSSPWHTIPLSADLPERFGGQSFSQFYPGQSSLTYRRAWFSAGVATDNEWWGPGIRNAIVLSSHAAGIPRLFLGTGRPVRTRIGVFEGRWMAGGLTESHYFDNQPRNNLRSLSAVAVTWRPKWVADLTLGVTRAVYAPVDKWGDIPQRLFNIFARTGRSNSLPLSDSSQIPGRDQVLSLFGRWVFPEHGFEVYGEWSRTELPHSVRDAFIAPNQTQGYTIGLQAARRLHGDRSTLRFQAELTDLEQGPISRDRPQGTYYTSRAVTQGYTQQGQVLGAFIGPGASSQWAALDFFARHWHIGVVAGRIRWEEDALYDLPGGVTGHSYCSHDVSLFGGLRGSVAGRFGRSELTMLVGKRYNLFFRNDAACGVSGTGGMGDVDNLTFELRFSPGHRRG